MRFKMIASLLVLALLSASTCVRADDDEKKREKTRKMTAQVLTDLYKTEPASKAAIEKAAGYAVFDNMGVNVLLLSTARGSGLAVNNKTKRETFMKMVSAGGGLGMGVKDYNVVFVFETEKGLAQFLDSGWSGSGQADAAAKAGEKGGAYSGAMEVAPAPERKLVLEQKSACGRSENDRRLPIVQGGIGDFFQQDVGFAVDHPIAEDGGYGRSPRTPWRPQYIFEDSTEVMPRNRAN